MELTTEKIGRSMKKRENISVPYGFVAAGGAAAAFGSAPASEGATGMPGKKIRAMPSTTTLSPDFRPLLITQRPVPLPGSPPTHAPTSTKKNNTTNNPNSPGVAT